MQPKDSKDSYVDTPEKQAKVRRPETEANKATRPPQTAGAEGAPHFAIPFLGFVILGGGRLFSQERPEESAPRAPPIQDAPESPEPEFDAHSENEWPGGLAQSASPGSLEEVSPPSLSGGGLETALALLRGPCRRGRAHACRMLERRANDGDARAAFELGRVLQLGLGDIEPRPSIALEWLQHALVGGVHQAAPLIVEVALSLGRGELANLAAAYERAVAPAHAPLRRRVRREMRAAPESPEKEPQGLPTVEPAKTRGRGRVVEGPDRFALWAQRKAERAESARQWRLNLTPPASPDPDPIGDPNRR